MSKFVLFLVSVLMITWLWSCSCPYFRGLVSRDHDGSRHLMIDKTYHSGLVVITSCFMCSNFVNSYCHIFHLVLAADWKQMKCIRDVIVISAKMNSILFVVKVVGSLETLYHLKRVFSLPSTWFCGLFSWSWSKKVNK